MRTTERLICLLESINAEAINNDGGKPGEFVAEVCRESAAMLRTYHAHQDARMREIEEALRDHHDGDHGC